MRRTWERMLKLQCSEAIWACNCSSVRCLPLSWFHWFWQSCRKRGQRPALESFIWVADWENNCLWIFFVDFLTFCASALTKSHPILLFTGSHSIPNRKDFNAWSRPLYSALHHRMKEQKRDELNPWNREILFLSLLLPFYLCGVDE